MKVNLLVKVATCSVVLMLFGSSHLVEASDQTVGGAADATFKPNGDVINPINPDEGGEIIPVRPPTAGPLSINYASNISFAKQEVSGDTREFYALQDTVTDVATNKQEKVANFVQVTDLRGSSAGWVLSVRQNTPLQTKDGTLLKGAFLTLKAYSLKSMNDVKKKPTGIAKEVVLSDDGQTQEVVRAEKGTGIGMWSVMLGDESDAKKGVRLSVPAKEKIKAGKYNTSLTWFLQDAF